MEWWPSEYLVKDHWYKSMEKTKGRVQKFVLQKVLIRSNPKTRDVRSFQTRKINRLRADEGQNISIGLSKIFWSLVLKKLR